MEKREKWWSGSRGEWWVAGQMLLMLAALVSPPTGNVPEKWRAGTRIGGSMLMGAGVLVAAAGMLRLGRNLTPLPYPRDNGTLITSGIYGLVRHPIYLGVLLGTTGWALLRYSLVGLLVTVALFVLFDRKAAREEAWLNEKHAGYAAYRRHIHKLIPWLYLL